MDYWRLGDSGTSDAVNQVDGGTATYNQVGLGAGGGPFADTTVARFGGSPQYLQLPQGLDGAGSQTVSLWFKTGTAGGVILSSSADAAGAATTPGNYTPMLYVGSDGKLYGKFWDGSTSVVMHSPTLVDDSKWHNAVLTAGGGSQDMLIDGVFAASESSTVTGGAAAGQTNVYAGTGFVGGNWPAEPHQSSTSSTGYASYFQGYMGELAFYPAKFSGTQVTAEYNAWKNSAGSTPTETETVTDPGNNTLTWVYDLLNGGRVLSQTDGARPDDHLRLRRRRLPERGRQPERGLHPDRVRRARQRRLHDHLPGPEHEYVLDLLRHVLPGRHVEHADPGRAQRRAAHLQ